MTGIDPDHFELPFECGFFLVLVLLMLFFLAWGIISLYRWIVSKWKLKR